jgi:hypothetical protein
MTGLRNKYCLSFFKAILFIVGLTFLVTQSSFKFYRFASFPFRVSSIKASCNETVSSGATKFLNHDKQARASLLLDKRYDFKHILIYLSPFSRLAKLPVESNKYFVALCVFFTAGAGQPESMRGPPHFA